MKELPVTVKFKYSWRKYQQRVLDELDAHFSDQHLHIVAPPGSGKTILGLEVVVRLNKPALILAPTLAIRNQWIKRFCDLFLGETECPEWIATDVRKPAFFTVTTYQALHAACAGKDIKISEEENDDEALPDAGEESENQTMEPLTKTDVIANSLKSQGVQVIVADEAHHLQNEWWATITEIKLRLEPKIIALTATPPYDVTPAEWQRYIEFAGPVDGEISVPELMLEGDLCPHQDLLFFTKPVADEAAKLNRFKHDSDKLFEELKSDQTIIEAIQKHPIWIAPMDQLDWIYNNLSCYSSCLIFMKANGYEIPTGHLEIIGDSRLTIPMLDYHWMEILLDFYLFKDRENFRKYREQQTRVEYKLKRAGLLEKRAISFTDNRRLSSMLTSSVSKLHAIREIVDIEYKQLGTALRMVVLCDFIRKEYLSDATLNAFVPDKTGVVPVFEQLRRNACSNEAIGVLTGSLIILPRSALAAFVSVASGYSVEEINAEPLSYDYDYVMIVPTGRLKTEMIHIITTIFELGAIHVLIGTRSLLGEGWDAPSINSLILASFVGSFVLSNQMRGRAIRTEKNNEKKTANIWHLVCLDPGAADGGPDMHMLKRRFKAFVGLSLTNEAIIANGIARLNIPDDIHTGEKYSQSNMNMFDHAAQRSALANRWKEALQSGTRLVEEIKVPFKEKQSYQHVKTFYLTRTLGYFFMTLVLAYGQYLYAVTQSIGRTGRSIQTPEQLFMFLSIVAGLGMLLFGGKTYQALRMFLKYRDIGKDVHRIGETLVYALVHAGYIRTSPAMLRVQTMTDKMGGVGCHLEGGTDFEESIFINALMEIVGPIGNPRYVIVRRNKLFGGLSREDYHAMPEVLGRNKTVAEYFAKEWQSRVGSCDLVYTRNIEGRKLLLASRLKSLAAQFEEPVEHESRWSY